MSAVTFLTTDSEETVASQCFDPLHRNAVGYFVLFLEPRKNLS